MGTLKKIAAGALILYATNAAVNTTLLLTSESFAARVDYARTTLAVVKNLKDDEYFQQWSKLYIWGKTKFDPELEQNVRHRDFYKKQIEKTEEEFEHRYQSICNPLQTIENLTSSGRRHR